MNVPNGPRMFKHGVNYPQATRQKLYSKNTVRDIGSEVRFVCTVEVHLVVKSAFWFLKNSPILPLLLPPPPPPPLGIKWDAP